MKYMENDKKNYPDNLKVLYCDLIFTSINQMNLKSKGVLYIVSIWYFKHL